MATQIDVINEALVMLGDTEISAEEFVASTTEGGRVMAQAWPAAVDFCLSAAPWRFASRLAQLSPEGITYDDQLSFAAPGYSRAWKVPDDHLRTNWLRDVASREAFPIQFHYEDGYWHTNSGSLFVSYVSHDFRAPESWTTMFEKVVSSYLAWNRGSRIRPAADSNALRLAFDAHLDAARTVDASETPFAWNVSGRLSRSRGGGYSGYGRGPQGYL